MIQASSKNLSLSKRHQAPSSLTMMRKVTCSICKTIGHNKRCCTQQPQAQAQQAAPATPMQLRKRRTTTITKPSTPPPMNPQNRYDLRDNRQAIPCLTDPINDTITKVHNHILSVTNPDIILLKQKEVIQWLFDDLSFLPDIDKKNKTTDTTVYKTHEDKWGQNILKLRRPDLKLDKQWTNKFGEHIGEEILSLTGKKVTKPVKKEHYQPDLEVEDTIWEIKTGTYHTTGTAGEKILGCPFKYAEIPDLYSKPLKIMCLGGAEKSCREQYGNLPGAKCTPQKQRFLNFFKENRIEFIAISDILRSLLPK